MELGKLLFKFIWKICIDGKENTGKQKNERTVNTTVLKTSLSPRNEHSELYTHQ